MSDRAETRLGKYQTRRWVFDARRSQLQIKGKPAVLLRPHASRALELLCLSVNQIVKRDRFIETIWEDNYLVGDKALSNVMWELRQKLPDGDRRIVTIPKSGYRLDQDDLKQSRAQPFKFAAIGAAAALIGALGWFWVGTRNDVVLLEDVELVSGQVGIEESPDHHPTTGQIVFAGLDAADSWLGLVSPAGGVERLSLDADGGVFGQPVFSPEGSRIAFLRWHSMKSGPCDVSVFNLETSALKKVAETHCPRMSNTPMGLDWHSQDDRLVFSAAVDSGGLGIYEYDIDKAAQRLLFKPSYLDLLPRYRGDELTFLRLSDPEHAHLFHHQTGTEPAKVFDASGQYLGFDWWGDRLVFTHYNGDQWVARSWSETEGLADIEHERGIKTVKVAGDNLLFSLQRSERGLFYTKLSDSNEVHKIPVANRMDLEPSLSPDGMRIVFVSDRTGHHEIWVSNVDGTEAEQLTTYGDSVHAPKWSPDGGLIVFDQRVGSDQQGTKVTVMDLDTRKTWSASDVESQGFIAGHWNATGSRFFSLQIQSVAGSTLWEHFPFSGRPSVKKLDGFSTNLMPGVAEDTMVTTEDSRFVEVNVDTGERVVVGVLNEGHMGFNYTQQGPYQWLRSEKAATLYHTPLGQEPTAIISFEPVGGMASVQFAIDEPSGTVVWSSHHRRETSLFTGNLRLDRSNHPGSRD